MKRLLAISSVVLALGGCAELKKIEGEVGIVTGNNVPPVTVYVAANAFDTAETTATNYLRLPLCPGAQAVNCRTTANSRKIVKAIRSGRPIRNQLEALVQSGQGGAPVPTSIYQTLTTAIAAVQNVITGG